MGKIKESQGQSKRVLEREGPESSKARDNGMYPASLRAGGDETSASFWIAPAFGRFDGEVEMHNGESSSTGSG